MLKTAAALFLACASIAMWVGCNTTTSNRYLYAAIPGSNEIVAYREDPNSGALTALAGSPITAGPSVRSLALHPSKKFLYAANSGVAPGNISLFTIASGGGLTEVTPRTNAGTAPTLLVMDAAGAFLYVGNTGSFDISVFSIDASSGALTQVTGSPFPVGLSPLNMALTPSGNFLYVTGGPTQGYIEGFPVTNGTLGTPIQPPLTGPGNDPTGLAIDSTGTHLYTANVQSNSISEFTINSDGTLAELGNSPVELQYNAPASLAIDKSGKYLYATMQGSTNMEGFSIGSDGGLTVLTTSPFGTAVQPSFIRSEPDGEYLFVGNQQSPGTVQSFSLDKGSGTLTSVSSYSVPGTPTSIVITP